MEADRRLRDAAKAVLDADISNLKSNIAHKGLTERAVDRVTDGARDVYDEAVEVAGDHTGVLAAILAALVLWFARNPILDVLFGRDDNQDEDWDEEADDFADW